MDVAPPSLKNNWADGGDTGFELGMGSEVEVEVALAATRPELDP